ncbi:hypothetical protein ACLBWT_06370 [Paenibacillus sp. D51F]
MKSKSSAVRKRLPSATLGLRKKAAGAKKGKSGPRKKARPVSRSAAKRPRRRKAAARRRAVHSFADPTIMEGSPAFKAGFQQTYTEGYQAGFGMGYEEGLQFAYETQPS